MARTGRPSKYTWEKAQKICAEVSKGRTIRAICSDDDMPVWDVVRNWINSHQEFQALYAQAKKQQIEAHLDLIQELNDQCAEEVRTIADPRRASALVNAYRLKVDTEKWLASKLIPRIYGDQLLLKDERTLPQRIQIEFVKPDITQPGPESDGK